MADQTPPFLKNNPAAADSNGNALPNLRPDRPQTAGTDKTIDPASVPAGGTIYKGDASEVSKKVNGDVTGPGKGPMPFKNLR